MSIGNARAKRAEAYLAKVGASLGLTECGRKWLTMAIDPFNDSLRNHDGFPDGSGALNIVEQIKETASILAPTGLGTATWDCLVLNFPWVLPQKFFAGAAQLSATTGATADLNNNLLNGYITNGGATAGLGGCTAFAAASTVNNWSLSTLPAAIQTQIIPPPQVVAGNYRITNMGFEVQNTTAPLFKQGTVTLFRTPVPTRSQASVSSVTLTGSPNFQIPAKVLNIDSWPVTSQAAFIAPDSFSFNAENGVYIPSVFNDLNDMGYSKSDTTVPFIVMGVPNGGTPSESSNQNGLPVPPSPSTIPTGGSPLFGGMEWAGVHISGCLFTGLSPQTSLQLNVKWGIEKFPSQNDGTLIPICKEVPDRDSVAIALYSHIIQSMPVGCMFGDNGFGDWIQDALNIAKEYIAPVLSAIPHPAAQGLKGFIDVGSTLVNYQKPKGQQQQQKKQQSVASIPKVQQNQERMAKAKAGFIGPLFEGQGRKKGRKRNRKPRPVYGPEPMPIGYEYDAR